MSYTPRPAQISRMLLAACGLAWLPAPLLAAQATEPAQEAGFLTATRQLTFEGARSGEGYFSADGKRIIFQSEREAGNPFYQIYLLDMETGDTRRLSPGHGKTTCAWVHPDGKRALFASTQDDPTAHDKQKQELADRDSGKERRYSWDYDPTYDLYEIDFATNHYQNLTRTTGYDAEGCYSPDGKRIVFASNRAAYSEPLSDQDKQTLEHDKSYFMEIYTMNADGSDLRRLTTSPGYDGGPFFSADGKKICWRRFSKDGAIAEIFTMNADGSDQKQLTRLGAMSWAPYFHPSGDYLIFATNKHGFANFELYLVDAAGKHDPVRVTHTDGFDGLPCFHPSGKQLSWTSNRTANKKSQLFIAEWSDASARKMLGLDGSSAAASSGAESLPTPQTASDITLADLRTHITTLASEKLEGRMTGTPGEQLATQYVADLFRSFGLAPAGDAGSFFQPFSFTAGVNTGPANQLTLQNGEEKPQPWIVNKDWRPLAFSKIGQFAPASIAFAGYGFVAPKSEDAQEYDSFVHANVAGKWVMVLRYVPEGLPEKQRQTLERYGSLRYKAMIARDRGAAGLIVVSGPNSKVKEQLVNLAFDAALSGTSIPAVSVTDEIAASLLKSAGKDLKQLHDTLDKGEMVMAFDLPGVKLGADIDLKTDQRQGRNVLARLQAGDKPSDEVVILGAHVDHLGRGRNSGSLMRSEDKTDIHFGADDNASGSAALLEIAQYLSDLNSKGKLPLKRDILFAAWSGEEVGLLGSAHFADAWSKSYQTPNKLPGVTAYLNMDMVGRYREKLTIQGLSTSSIWPQLIEQANAPVGLAINTQNDAYLPTDSTSFYFRGVPILSAFTGAHAEYHTPRDTPDLINYEAEQKIARLVALMTRNLAMRDQAPDYIAVKPPANRERRGGLRAYLGTIPDYAQTDVKGLKLSGVAKDGPAEKAGLQGGDIITQLGEKKIENIYDYTYAIETLKIDQPTKIQVQRGDKSLDLTVTPKSRD